MKPEQHCLVPKTGTAEQSIPLLLILAGQLLKTRQKVLQFSNQQQQKDPNRFSNSPLIQAEDRQVFINYVHGPERSLPPAEIQTGNAGVHPQQPDETFFNQTLTFHYRQDAINLLPTSLTEKRVSLS